jgi:hypothetical protein
LGIFGKPRFAAAQKNLNGLPCDFDRNPNSSHGPLPGAKPAAWPNGQQGNTGSPTQPKVFYLLSQGRQTR